MEPTEEDKLKDVSDKDREMMEVPESAHSDNLGAFETVELPDIPEEVQKVITAKREELMSQNPWLMRFMSLDEFREMMSAGKLVRKSEAILLDTPGDLFFHVRRGGYNREHYPHKHGSIPKGLIWSDLSAHFTDMRDYTPYASEAQVNHLTRYKKIYDSLPKETEERRGKARSIFIQELKKHILERGMNIDAHENEGLNEDYLVTDEQIAEAKEQHFKHASAEDREKLLSILEKSDSDISDDEIRLMLTYARPSYTWDQMHSYELIALFSSKTPCEKHGWSNMGGDRQWRDLPEGTPARELIGVILMISNKIYLQEVEKAMLSESEQDPGVAYPIIGLDGKEVFPEQGIDITPDLHLSESVIRYKQTGKFA